MSEKNIDYAIKILREDIEVCTKFFEKPDFSTINMIANRYIENCLIFNVPNLILPGVFIKELVFDYVAIFNNPSKLKIQNSIKIVGDMLISKIRDFFTNLNEKELWNDFYEYNYNINEFLRDEVSNYYVKSPPFTSLTFEFLLDFIEKNLNSFFLVKNKFFDVILITMVRVFRNHYFKLKELMIYVYIKFLTFLYRYIYFEYINSTKDKKEQIKKDFTEYLKYIISLKGKEEIDVSSFNENLWNIVKKWRKMYFFYKNVQIEKEDILLPLELKKEESKE